MCDAGVLRLYEYDRPTRELHDVFYLGDATYKLGKDAHEYSAGDRLRIAHETDGPVRYTFEPNDGAANHGGEGTLVVAGTSSIFSTVGDMIGDAIEGAEELVTEDVPALVSLDDAFMEMRTPSLVPLEEALDEVREAGGDPEALREAIETAKEEVENAKALLVPIEDALEEAEAALPDLIPISAMVDDGMDSVGDAVAGTGACHRLVPIETALPDLISISGTGACAKKGHRLVPIEVAAKKVFSMQDLYR